MYTAVTPASDVTLATGTLTLSPLVTDGNPENQLAQGSIDPPVGQGPRCRARKKRRRRRTRSATRPVGSRSLVLPVWEWTRA